MKTRAYVHSSNVVSARALENIDLKRVISAAASIATLIWHDLEPNMQDKQFFVRAYGKSNSLFLVKFCYILPACLTKKSVIYVQNSSPELNNYKINIRTQSIQNLFETVPRSLLFTHVFSE